MKKISYKTIGRWFLQIFTTVLWLVFTLTTATAFADEESQTKSASKDEKIYISADRLTTDTEAREAEFTGNVKVTQGTTEITADRLKIFYTQIPDAGENMGSNDASIQKIVANGHVQIKFENRLAVSEQAVYIAETRVIILSGPNSKVSSGDNYITGEKIILYREDGKITVEGDVEKRVEAVFHTGEKGLQ